VLDNELTCQGSDKKVKMLKTGGWNAKNGTHRGSDEARDRQDQYERPPTFGGQNGCGIGPYPEKGPVAEGDLSGIADEEIETYGSDGINPYRVKHIKKIRTGDERNDTEKDCKPDNEPNSSEIRFKYPKLLQVGGPEIATGVKL
jgi:hypothetical protein